MTVGVSFEGVEPHPIPEFSQGFLCVRENVNGQRPASAAMSPPTADSYRAVPTIMDSVPSKPEASYPFLQQVASQQLKPK